MKAILAASEKQGKFQALKDNLKIQNHPRGQADLNSSFYDQNLAIAGVRRFIEPSEGDSIFNYDRDIKKKAKLRASLGNIPKQSMLVSPEQQEAIKQQSPLRKKLEQYRVCPEDVIQDAKRFNYKRMQKQSAYTNVKGYKCSAIQAQIKNVSRKRAILDAHHDPLKQRIVNGHVDFVDVEESTSPMSQSRQSFSSLKDLLELHKVPIVIRQDKQPAQTASDFKSFQALPLKKQAQQRSKQTD